MFRLVFCVSHPRCLVQYEVFQALVLLQTAHQRGLVAFLRAPLLKHLPYLRRTVQHIVGKRVGVERTYKTYRIVFIHIANVWQCLYHQPRRVVSIFYGYFIVEWRLGCRDSYFLHSGTVLRERNGICHHFHIRKDRQIMLFTVTIAVA